LKIGKNQTFVVKVYQKIKRVC